jgi:guanylate kinase
MAALEQRLRGRGTDSEQQIALRLSVSRQELSRRNNYAYWVVNDDLDVAVDGLIAVVRAERLRRERLLPDDSLLAADLAPA